MQILFRKYDKLFGTLFGSLEGEEERRLGWSLFLVVKDTAYKSQDHVEVVSLYNMLVCALNFILWRLAPPQRARVVGMLKGGATSATLAQKEASLFPTVTAELQAAAAEAAPLERPKP